MTSGGFSVHTRTIVSGVSLPTADSLGLRRRIARYASALEPQGPWDWDRFQRQLCRLLRAEAVLVLHVSSETVLRSGELSGAAMWRDKVAVICIPEDTSLAHQIHIAGHEAWHLLAGHDGCSGNHRSAEERESELFATRLGTLAEAQVKAYRRGSLNLMSAMGVTAVVR